MQAIQPQILHNMPIQTLITLGTGTSGMVPNIWCLCQTPISCNVCQAACRWSLINEETGKVVFNGSQVPGYHHLASSLLHSSENGQNDGIGPNFPSQQGLATQNHENHVSLSKNTALNINGNEKYLRMVWDKNRRRNTSAIVLYKHSDGTTKTIVIDAGKSFYTAALDVFVKFRLSKIDALILTHGHADAMLGMDDLRQWTIGGKIQHAIHVYCNDETMNVVGGGFPYLVDRSQATGGGDVPSLQFHRINTDPFTLFGELKVIPLEVDHGVVKNGQAYKAFGYRFEDLAYISDVNYIPPSTMDRLQGVKVMVVDALKDSPHPSHFSIDQAVHVLKSIHAKYGILVGWSHFMLHDDINALIEERHGKELSRQGLKIEAGWDGMVVHMKAYR